MADKRYYWLKLKEDYFNSPKIKKLRKIAGGDTYTIIYLKMQLLSISNNGIIQFEGIEPTLQEELALKLDEDVENVNATLIYIKSQGLIEESDNKFLLLDASNCIGSECDSAERVRQFREKNKQGALQCNACVTQVKQISISNSISNSNSISSSKIEEKEIKKEKETKHKHGEYKNVLLTDTELEKLKQDFGEQETEKAITYLDEYIEMKGYKAKSHNLAIRKWVFNALKEQKQKQGYQKPQQSEYISGMTMPRANETEEEMEFKRRVLSGRNKF